MHYKTDTISSPDLKILLIMGSQTMYKKNRKKTQISRTSHVPQGELP